MISIEQQAIIDEIIKKSNNVACCAVAGSGKTTTVIELAKQCEGRVLQITYNARLKHEVREKAPQNLTVHTYHSMVCSFYGKAYTDEEIDNIIKINKKLKVKARAAAKFDIIVIDECQDMTRLYFDIINKLITDTNFDGEMLLLGDIKQSINEFRGSDVRYLTLPKVWRRKFVSKPLSTSFRLTAPVAKFVSTITGQNIVAIKDGNPIKYLFGDYSTVTMALTKEINILLSTGYEPGDIFILAPSMKSSHTLSRMLESALVKQKVMCYVDCESDRVADKELVYDNKIVFCTINSTKGLERKIVILFNFDSSYVKYYSRDLPSHICSNALYVAMTRTREQLYLVHTSPDTNLTYVTPESHQYLEFTISKPVFNYGEFERPKDVYKKFTVLELIAHTHFDIIGQITEKLNFDITSGPSTDIPVANVESFVGGNYEFTSDIVGVAIPIMYECYLARPVKSKYLDETDKIPKTPAEFAKAALKYISTIQEINYKTAQVTNFEWFTEEISSQLHDNIKIIKGVEEFEASCDIIITEHMYQGQKYKISITGSIDIVAKGNVWEVKCVSELTTENLMQLLFYNLLYHVNLKTVKDFAEIRTHLVGKKIKPPKLINLRTGEIRSIWMSAAEYCELAEIIINSKLFVPKISDEEFELI
jgi:hypothetical protein